MKKFTMAVNGYNKHEVNNFVSKVIIEYESLLNKLKLKDQEIAILKQKAERFNGMENSLNRALIVAENSSSEMRKVAKEEANLEFKTPGWSAYMLAYFLVVLCIGLALMVTCSPIHRRDKPLQK